MQRNIIKAIKHLQMNEISALNNPWGVDRPLNNESDQIKANIFERSYMISSNKNLWTISA